MHAVVIDENAIPRKAWTTPLGFAGVVAIILSIIVPALRSAPSSASGSGSRR